MAQVATVSGTRAYTDTYVYSPSGAPLELIRQSASAGPCGSTTCRYWYELDGQGSVVALTDSSGHVVDSYSYDAWGTPVSVSEQVPQRLRYRGYWYDQELGTYWLSVRQYDPLLKRFVQPDPSHIEGFASYVYADSDPVDNADPSGTLPGNTNRGPDMIYCGGLPGGEYDYPPDPQPGDPCYYDINCYYDGTATADDIAQIDQANAAAVAYGQAMAAADQATSTDAGTPAVAAAMCACDGEGGGPGMIGGPGEGVGGGGGEGAGGGEGEVIYVDDAGVDEVWQEGDPLPNAEDAYIDMGKVRYGVTSPGHIGAFESAGFDMSTEAGIAAAMAWVVQQIKDGLDVLPAAIQEAQTGLGNIGPRFVVEIPGITPNGQVWMLRTAWIIEYGSNFARILTVYLRTIPTL